jgi:streptogramin lyase
MKSYCLIWLLACGCCATALANGPLIDPVAGTGAPEDNGASGPAVRLNIGEPFGVEMGPDGALYITEVRNHRIRRLDLTTGNLTTVAGCGRRGYSGDNGPAISAELNEPYEVRFDADRNMYFVEMKNHLVRRIDAKTNEISTLAGTGRQGFGGDGGPATEALFSHPHSIALDHHGALYVADIGNHRIRRIDLKTRVIETVAGNGQTELPREGQVARGNPALGPRALFVDRVHLWIALREGHSIWRMDLNDGLLHHVAGTGKPGYSGDGGPAVKAALNGPKGIAVAPDGDVFVADTDNNAIRRIDARSGRISTVAVNRATQKDISVRDEAAAHAPLNRPHGICLAPDGVLFIGDTLSHRIHRLRLQD